MRVLHNLSYFFFTILYRVLLISFFILFLVAVFELNAKA